MFVLKHEGVDLHLTFVSVGFPYWKHDVCCRVSINRGHEIRDRVINGCEIGSKETGEMVRSA